MGRPGAAGGPACLDPGRGIAAALALVACLWLAGCPAPAQTPVRFPAAEWDHVPAAQAGLDPMRFERLAREVGGAGLVVRDGRVVFRWGGVHRNVGWGAVARPVLDSLLLFAVEEGTLPGLDQRIGEYVEAEFGAEAAQSLGGMSFADLAGLPGAVVRPVDYARLLFSAVYGAPADRVARAPQRLGALRPQDEPLFGGRARYALVASPRDMARIGLWWLNDGYWQGMQLLPARKLGGMLGGDGDPSGPRIAGEPWVNTDQALWPRLPADTWVSAGADGAVVILPGRRVVAVWHAGEGSTPAPADLGAPLVMLERALEPVEPLSPGIEALRLPAEELELEGFQAEPGPVSSLISLAGESATGSGTARHTFRGAAGIYDIVVAYHDEADGQGRLALRVDGVLADEWVLDRDPNLGHADPANLVLHRAARGVPLAPGSVLELAATADRDEGMRVDYIDLVPTDVAIVAGRPE